MRPVGFYTRDLKWIEFIETSFHQLARTSRQLMSDASGEHIKRDEALMDFYAGHYKAHAVRISDYDLTIEPDVFPSHLGAATEPLVGAIRKVGESLKRQFGKAGVGGVDLGTGCGILAFALAEHCDFTIGTDTNRAAILNARANAERLNRDLTRFGNLSFVLTDSARHAFSYVWEYPVVLAVFNFPFYKSAFNIYNWGGQDSGASLVKKTLDELVEIEIIKKTVLLLPEPAFDSSYSLHTILEEYALPYRVETVGGRSIYLVNSDLLVD
jgi:hypothetical protein